MAAKTLPNIRIVAAERLRNSVNGNPRFTLTLFDAADDYTWQANTATDASCGYEVTNHVGRGPVNITISGRGTVIGIDKV